MKEEEFDERKLTERKNVENGERLGGDAWG